MNVTAKKFKVVLVGASSVGKTSIVMRFSKDSFSPGQESTIGAAFLSRDVPTPSGVVCLHIWDTAGQELYRSLVPRYSQGASAIIIVFDVTDPESFESAKQWLDETRAMHSDKLIWYLVGNKIDEKPGFDLTIAQTFALEQNLNYIETSAKTGQNIDELFISIAQMVPRLPPEPGGVDMTNNPPPSSKNSCC